MTIESGGFVHSDGILGSRGGGSIDDVAEESEVSYSRRPRYGLEANNFYVQPTYHSNKLPVAQSMGVAYNYEITGKFDIPSTGKALQIPVDSFL